MVYIVYLTKTKLCIIYVCVYICISEHFVVLILPVNVIFMYNQFIELALTNKIIVVFSDKQIHSNKNIKSFVFF